MNKSPNGIDLPHLQQVIFNQPHAITNSRAEAILSAISERIISGKPLTPVDLEDNQVRYEANLNEGERFGWRGSLLENGVAVVSVVGTTVRRGSFLSAVCGLSAYDQIVGDVEEALSHPSTRGLLFEMDTYGGEAQGVFDAARAIKKLAAESGVPFWAHANEACCSAGYALASGADRFCAAQTALVGSIGVIAAHLDVSEQDKQKGHKWSIIHAGQQKPDLHPHKPLGNDARARLQADVDNINEMFCSMVADHRGSDLDEIKGHEAAVYRGQLAVEANLAEEIMPFQECLAAFASHLDANETQPTRSFTFTKGGSMSKISLTTEELEEKIAAGAKPQVDAALAEQAATHNTKLAAAVDAERERAVGLFEAHEQSAKLGASFDFAASMKAGHTAEAVKAASWNALADADSNIEIDTEGGHPDPDAKDAAEKASKNKILEAAAKKAFPS
ncbi:S49 family peptidase [Pseudovibrio ascidiaceicola]|uniref:S49 family peptidase n=1 Tax=Pseudovibrio ascidiaceicola TaxID=285279 RepID=UPI003D35AF0C